MFWGTQVDPSRVWALQELYAFVNQRQTMWFQVKDRVLSSFQGREAFQKGENRGKTKQNKTVVLQFQQQQYHFFFFFNCSAYLEKSLFLSLRPSSAQVPELVFAIGEKASLLITPVLGTQSALPLTELWAADFLLIPLPLSFIHFLL